MKDALPGSTSSEDDNDGTTTEITWDPIFSLRFKNLPV